MNILYRQGLLGFPANFLQVGAGGFINLVINDIPVTATAASGDTNYLITETRTVLNAWGPFSGTATQYLFWDINRFNGEITRGATVLAPIVSAVPPTETIDQHWWDTSTNKMKRWTGTKWDHVIRVFAASLTSGAILSPYPLSSQVGLSSPSTAGYILSDGFGGVFKGSNGELLTSDTQITSIDTGSLVKFEGSQIIAVANESIPAFSLVYYVGPYRVGLASGVAPDNINKAPIGIIIDNALQNDTTTVITAGRVVTNEFWNWDPSLLGKSVYCGPTGEIVTDKFGGFKNMRVGVITSTNSVLLTFDWETDVVESAGGGILSLSVVGPIVKNGTASSPILSISRSSEISNGYLHQDDFQRIVALETQVAQKADIGHLHSISNISGLQTLLDSKTPFGHTHTIPDVDGLTLALDAKSDVGHTHIIADIAGLQGQLSSINLAIASKMPTVPSAVDGRVAAFLSGNVVDSGIAFTNISQVGHTHTILNVTGLHEALDGKAALVHGHSIANVANLQSELDAKSPIGHFHLIPDITGLQSALDAKASVSHSHAISDVTGLQLVLDGKANLSHSHVIGDITGLQLALDGKANLTHTHVIGEVTGLQLALDSKSNLVHTHAITDVAGLQLALDGKASLAHTHVIADVVGLQTELNAKIAFNNTTPYTPLTDYNPASKLYVDSRTLADLSDVSATIPALNNVLQWNGTQWVPAAVGGGYTAPATEIVFGGTTSNTSSTNLVFLESQNSFFTNFDVSSDDPKNGSQVRIRNAHSPLNEGAAELWFTPSSYDGNPLVSNALLSAGGSADNSGGDVELKAGWSENAAGGSVYVRAGGSTTSGVGGQVFIRSGDSFDSDAGEIYLQAGDSVESDGGNVRIIAGYSEQDDGGEIYISGGSPGPSSSGNGGRVRIFGGSTSGEGAAGDVRIVGGDYVGSDEYSGGGVQIVGGDSMPYEAGSISISAGNSGSDVFSQGGYVHIRAGTASTALSSGDIVFITNEFTRFTISRHGEFLLKLGPTDDPGTPGQVIMSNGPGLPPTWQNIDTLTVKTENSSYTAILADGNGRTLVRMESSSPLDFTVPNDASVNFPIGAVLMVSQSGTGQVTIVPDSGVTINTPETLLIRKQHGKVSLIKVAANEWDIEGNLEPM